MPPSFTNVFTIFVGLPKKMFINTHKPCLKFVSNSQ